MADFYLYGVVGGPGPSSPPVRGLGGSPTLFIPSGDLVAVVSRSPISPWPADAEHLRLHEAVVEELMRSRAILPARFNTFLRTEDAIRALLQERAEEFRAALARVRGKCELGLRILWSPPDDPLPGDRTELTGGPGSEYLTRRVREARRGAARRRAGAGLIHSVHATIRPLASDWRLYPFPSDRFLFAAAYLVDQDQIGAFGELLAGSLADSPGLGFLLTGPWPPYHFVTGVGGENGIANRLRV